MHLQNAEDTICLGWLLNSSLEYNREALRHAIWQLVGIEVALRFRKIATPRKAAEHGIPTRALHIEVNRTTANDDRPIIEKLYSRTSEYCPLGIKMQLVPPVYTLMNPRVVGKAVSMRERQKSFLAHSDSCTSWELVTLDLWDDALQADLRTILHLLPDPKKPDSRLFLAVNPMFDCDGFVFRFHPSKSATAREVVAGLRVFLGGVWEDMIAPMKFNKYFTATAIERAQNTWWDPVEKCVVTSADTTLDNLVDDDDPDFVEYKIEVDSSILEDKDEVPKPADYECAESLSTFHSQRRLRTRSSTRASGKIKAAKVGATPYSETPSVLTASSISDEDIKNISDRVMAQVTDQLSKLDFLSLLGRPRALKPGDDP